MLPLPDFTSAPRLPTTRNLDWGEMVTLAITRPSPATFRTIAQSPQASAARAVKWVLLSAVGAWILSVVYALVRGTSWTWLFLAGVVAYPALAVLGFLVITRALNWLGNKLGEPVPYGQTALACAAFYAPGCVLAAFSFGSPFFLLVLLAWLVLHVVAAKGVHTLSWGKAFVASLPAWAAVGLVFCAAATVLVAALRSAG